MFALSFERDTEVFIIATGIFHGLVNIIHI
jgi:hypothetical protein